MDYFDDSCLDDILDESSFDMDSGYDTIDLNMDSIMDEWMNPDMMNDKFDSSVPNDNSVSDISFKGHLEELYNPDIQRAQEDYDFHMSKLVDSTNLSDMKFHLEKAEQAKDSEQFFQDCLEEARRNQAIDEARLDSITRPAEIAKQYQQEIEDILYPNR